MSIFLIIRPEMWQTLHIWLLNDFGRILKQENGPKRYLRGVFLGF